MGEMQAAEAELFLQVASDMREGGGNMEITGPVPGDTPFLEDDLDEGKQYAREAAICLKMMEFMSKMSLFKDDSEFMEALKLLWVKIVSKRKLDPQELKDEVQVAERLQEATMEVFMEKKSHMKYGAAPRSSKERKLRSMMSQLQMQGN